MELKLEVVPVPVTDVDRAKRFYSEQLGFAVDLDTQIGPDTRLVQLTPPGSGCSIHLNTGITTPPPGSVQGLTLVVGDIHATRAELVERGLQASNVQHFQDGAMVDGAGEGWNSYVHFNDPDGNGWMLQQRPPPG